MRCDCSEQFYWEVREGYVRDALDKTKYGTYAFQLQRFMCKLNLLLVMHTLHAYASEISRGKMALLKISASTATDLGIIAFRCRNLLSLLIIG